MEHDFTLTGELMAKVNKYTRKQLKAEDIYAFPVILCDNEIDRDNERFSIEALRKLAVLFVGKTGIFDHNPKGENQTARIFDVGVKVDTEKTTSAGEPYTCLVAKAYMVRTAKSADLIAEIEGGIKKEVSVSCSVKKEICSICGADMRKAPCTHIKGAVYGDKLCSVILDEPFDAYEWSFVAVPAQKNAGVAKKFGEENNGEAVVEMKSRLAQMRKENAAARDIIKREILRLSFLCNPILTVKTVGMLTEAMDFEQLLELKENLERDLQAKSASAEEQPKKAVDAEKNQYFKIN